MNGVATASLLAKRPRPRPHIAAKDHPDHDAQGHSRAKANATTPPVKSKKLSASKDSPFQTSKSITSTPGRKRSRIGQAAKDHWIWADLAQI
jgi:hypothetical protein